MKLNMDTILNKTRVRKLATRSTSWLIPSLTVAFGPIDRKRKLEKHPGIPRGPGIPRPRAKGPGATQAPREPETHGTKGPRDSQVPRDPDAAGTNGLSGPSDSQGPRDQWMPREPRTTGFPRAQGFQTNPNKLKQTEKKKADQKRR